MGDRPDCARRTVRTDFDRVVDLVDVLDTVAEFRSASVELVAWEFDVPVSAIERPWRIAVDSALLQRSDLHLRTGEAMFELTPRGQALLHDVLQDDAVLLPGRPHASSGTSVF